MNFSNCFLTPKTRRASRVARRATLSHVARPLSRVARHPWRDARPRKNTHRTTQRNGLQRAPDAGMPKPVAHRGSRVARATRDALTKVHDIINIETTL